MREFKIRSSASNKILGGTIGLSEAQQETFDKLSAKDNLTKIQLSKLQSLQDKIDNPPLPEGLKTYCKTWLKTEIFGKNKRVYSKYFDKGNVQEEQSISDAAKLLNLGMVFKNEDYFENDFMTGTPDIVLADEIIDMKNSWDETTFPYFDKEIPNKDYYYQLQSYMALTGKRKARLVYFLSDTPEHLIEREARYSAYDKGFDDVSIELLEMFTDKMTYSDIPMEKRIKVFNVEYDEAAIEQIKFRVDVCRKYIKTLL